MRNLLSPAILPIWLQNNFRVDIYEKVEFNELKELNIEGFLLLKQKCQEEIRRKKEERKEKLSFCNECTRKQDCGRGCPGLQIKNNKLYYGLDPICPNLHSNATQIINV